VGEILQSLTLKSSPEEKLPSQQNLPSYRPPFKHKIILKLSKNAYIAH
jgi:hypothetical protein